ncbi:uncharacterized protein [Battus philenor]|uniref:uncharacterized protein n=1 Tax=Battus philenor TaxID=42288 RepID=UPI0035D0D079
MATRSAVVLLFLIVLLGEDSAPSLLSRFRNRHEYVPNADLEVIKSLDDKTYEDLMNEMPILRQVLRGTRRRGAFRHNATALPELRVRSDVGRDVGRAVSTATPATPGTTPSYRTYWPVSERTTSAPVPRRTAAARASSADWHVKYPHVTSCYWCGLNESLLPTSTLCHDAFAGDEPRALGAARFLRAHCHLQAARGARVQARYDAGLQLAAFGPYMRGCFKRYVDVGRLYTARGCRGDGSPQRALLRNFAAHRLARLELVARGRGDACVHSPHASLTPFSRAVSLYVRYHVCVCSRPYCNAAPARRAANLLFSLPIAFIRVV